MIMFLFSLGHFTVFLWLQQSRGRKIYDVENMSLKVTIHSETWWEVSEAKPVHVFAKPKFQVGKLPMKVTF